MSPARCEANVWDATGFHRYQCQRLGKEWVGMAFYCRQHAAIARRRIERDKQHPVFGP